MKLWGTMLVRDEADVVAATIEHARYQGVEHLVVTDNASVDDTREILADYASHGFVTLIDEPNTEYRQSEWVTRMAHLASAGGADWIVHLDADEFPRSLLRNTTVADELARVAPEVTVIQSPRRNLHRRRGDNRSWTEALVWKDVVSRAETGVPIGPKVMHRSDAEVTVLMGNHAVEGPLLGTPDASPRFEYLHVPDRSWRQYEQKIRLGGSAVESNQSFDAGVAWHWRSEYARLLDGTLRSEYEKRQLSTRVIAASVLRRTMTRDTSLASTLRALVATAIIPARLEDVLRA